MSVTIFSKQSGFVSSFQDPTLPAAVTLKVEGWGGFGGFKAIITRVNVAAQGNYQFLHTLGGSIYVYVFGDRVGQLGISGLAFDSACDDDAGTLGIERVLDYYVENRIAARQTPLKVTIGARTTVAGYLVAVAGDVVDPKSKIYQFNLQFMMAPNSGIVCTVPEESGDGDGGDNDTAKTTDPVSKGGGDGSSGNPGDPGGKGNVPTFAALETVPSLDGGFPGTPTTANVSDGFSSVGTGPNVSMVKAQVS